MIWILARLGVPLNAHRRVSCCRIDSRVQIHTESMGSERSDDVGAPIPDEGDGLLSSVLMADDAPPKSMFIMPGPWPANPLQAVARSPHRPSRPPPTPRDMRMKRLGCASSAQSRPPTTTTLQRSANGSLLLRMCHLPQMRCGQLRPRAKSFPVLSPEEIQTTGSSTSDFRLPLSPDAMPENFADATTARSGGSTHCI